MRAIKFCVAILAIAGFSTASYADPAARKFRLAQSSTTTNCMMSCNSQAANCQTTCLVPGTPPTGAATATSNATASTSCLLGCTTQQVACQTVCAQISPSQ
jgi:hypothetical protein